MHYLTDETQSRVQINNDSWVWRSDCSIYLPKPQTIDIHAAETNIYTGILKTLSINSCGIAWHLRGMSNYLQSKQITASFGICGGVCRSRAMGDRARVQFAFPALMGFKAAARPPGLSGSVGIFGESAEAGDAFEKSDSFNSDCYIAAAAFRATQGWRLVALEHDGCEMVTALPALIFPGWHWSLTSAADYAQF